MSAGAEAMALDMTEPERAGQALTLQEVADGLGVHYMTAYRYVRQGRLPARKRGSQWIVDRSDFDAFETRRAGGGGAEAPVRDAPWAQRLEDRLLNGDAGGAWDVAVGAMNSGKSPDAFHMEVLAPALRSIGDRWEKGEITVGDEHRASTVAMRLIGRLAPRFSPPGRKRGTVIIATPPGDLHDLPVAIVADMARQARFEVVDLGCDVPADSLAAAIVDQDNLRAVALGSTLPDNDSNVRIAIEAAREAALASKGMHVPILLGGSAIEGADHALALGADAWAADASEAVDLMVSAMPTKLES